MINREQKLGVAKNLSKREINATYVYRATNIIKIEMNHQTDSITSKNANYYDKREVVVS